MRKVNIISVVAVVTLCVLTLLGGISLANNVTSGSNPHNLSFNSVGYRYTTFQVCVFCHTPHGGNTDVQRSTFWNSSGYQNLGGTGSLLLWNRDITNSASKSFYTYTSSTQDASPTGQVRVYSLMCMSCHDGVSAINVMSNLPNEYLWFWGYDPYVGSSPDGLSRAIASTTPYSISSGSGGQRINIGEMSGSDTVADLANDHPISFDYDATLVANDKGLVTPDNAQGYVGDTAVRLFYSPETGTLSSMECSTCHDPHMWYEDYRKPFLVMSNQNSALCLNCHIK